MKKALLFAAVALMSTSALASKARRTALGNSPQITDIQDIAGDVQVGGNMFIAEPDKAAAYGEWATMEFGQTASAATAARAEGGFVRMMGNGALGVYLGAPNATADGFRSALDRTAGLAGATATLKQENPLRVFYGTKAGDITWGAGLLYSNSKESITGAATSARKQDASGVVASASGDVWDAQLGLGLSNNSTTTVAAGDNKVTGKATFQVTGGYKIDTMYVYGGYSSAGAKGETPATTLVDRADNELRVGVVNSHKKYGTDFFYGIEYDSATAKDDASTVGAAAGTNSLNQASATKLEQVKIPLFVGIEAEAASWLVLRASLNHSFSLLGLNKTKITTNNNTDKEFTSADSTTVAAGAGIKWNKFMFDGVLASSTSGTGTFGSDGANFLTNASLTYTF